MKVRQAYGEFRSDPHSGSITVNCLKLQDGQQEVSGVTLLVEQLESPDVTIAGVFVDMTIPEAASLALRIGERIGVYPPRE